MIHRGKIDDPIRRPLVEGTVRKFALVFAAILACGPDPEEQPLDQTHEPISFREIDSRIIQPRCSPCHGAPDDDRSTAASLTYRRVVDGPSVRLPEMDLVGAGE